MSRRLAAAAVAAALAVSLTACSSDGGSDSTATTGGSTASTMAPDRAGKQIEARQVGTLGSPTALVVRPGDDHLWSAERFGTIRQVTVRPDGSLKPNPKTALDLTDQTTTDAERGLLDIVFSADGATLYVSTTDRDGNTRVASYAVSKAGRVDASSRKVLLAQDQPYPNHNGGNLELGPDGRLWFGFGDGGAGDDPENRAQDPSTPLGKIVRIDPDGGAPEIVISGVRNPWRFTFDTDDSLWIGDVGQNKVEEIDHLQRDEIEGANLGWSGYEGLDPYLDGDGRRPDTWVEPVYTYPHEDGNCSITGGFVYRGKALPELQGAYLFADYCKGDVLAFRPDDPTASPAEQRGKSSLIITHVNVERPISFAFDADGEPFVLSETGAVVRLVPNT